MNLFADLFSAGKLRFYHDVNLNYFLFKLIMSLAVKHRIRVFEMNSTIYPCTSVSV